jgi:hypothetical protein
MKMRYAKHKTTGKVIATMSGGDESNVADLQSFIDSGLGYAEVDLDIGYATKEQIATWTAATVTDAEKVIIKRVAEYPSIKDQLDMQYWDKENNTTTWADAITKVKTENPKS